MICLHCGSETKNPKFCSSSCSASFNNKGIRRHGNGEEKPCLNCGTILYKRKFCSNKCQGQYRIKISCEKVEANQNVNWNLIKQYLLKRDGKCIVCGITEWMGLPISLECDHIDGDITNNRLSNARLLCPNCHSQTDTFRAKNVNNPNGKDKRRERYYKNIKGERNVKTSSTLVLE